MRKYKIGNKKEDSEIYSETVKSYTNFIIGCIII